MKTSFLGEDECESDDDCPESVPCTPYATISDIRAALFYPTFKKPKRCPIGQNIFNHPTLARGNICCKVPK